MCRKLVVFYSLAICATEVFGLFDILRTILEEKDQNITRVRTVAELEARKNELVVLDFIGLVQRYKGYTAEEYEVETEDGYFLKLHRITGSPRSPAAPGKPVVYLQHGLFGSSDFHVLLGSQQALTFLLADEGFDIWLGNVRGTTYSKHHANLSSLSNNYDFWKFSLDEVSTIDIPKFIDTVLEKTKAEKLTFIGYSLGTTESYMFLADKPEYNSKMKLVVSLAPIAFFTKPYSPRVKTVLLVEPPIKLFAELNRYYEVLAQEKILQFIGAEVCNSTLGHLLCDDFVSSSVNPKYMNFSIVPELLAYVPAGTSLNTIDHCYQLVVNGDLRKYDFGNKDTNLARYGSVDPPKYDFSKITAPQAIYYADMDAYITLKDAETLRDKLKNVVIFDTTPKGYNHLDFIWAMNARDDFYVKIVDEIKKFQ